MIDDFIVCVRKRPTFDSSDAIIISSNTLSVHEEKTKITLEKYTNIKTYDFDYVYDENSDTRQIYMSNIKPHIDDNNNFICYTFGETGSGKTHTLFGSNNSNNKSIGLIENTISELIKINTSVLISSYEIYNNELYDLLNNNTKLLMCEQNKELNILGLTFLNCNKINLFEILNIIKNNRMVGISSENDQSSRSHCIITIKTSNKSYMFVDLAGSEKAIKSICSNKKEYQESGGINLDILALKECIRNIKIGNHHIPFRQTKLTMILRETFLNDFKILILITISPEISNIQETYNILSYANDLKNSKKNIQLNNNKNIQLNNNKNIQLNNNKNIQLNNNIRSVTPIPSIRSITPIKQTKQIKRSNSSPTQKSNYLSNNNYYNDNNNILKLPQISRNNYLNNNNLNDKINNVSSDVCLNNKQKKLKNLILNQLNICDTFFKLKEDEQSKLIDKFGYDLTKNLVDQILIIKKIDKNFHNKFVLR